MNALSLFTGAGGMDVGFQEAGFNIVWANEIDQIAAGTYKKNNPNTIMYVGDIRMAKSELNTFKNQGIDLIFGGPPCQGFSVAGKMDPNDIRSKLIWEFLDIVELIAPKVFVIENVKALHTLTKWNSVREGIISKADSIGYHCFHRVLNAADFGVPQNRERVFFIGLRKDKFDYTVSKRFDTDIQKYKRKRVTVRECLKDLERAGTKENPITCTAKIQLAKAPILRKSPYAGMLFNGLGRPLALDKQANTLPASMGGNKTPIIDESLLYNENSKDWIADYHRRLLQGEIDLSNLKVPSYIRRLTTTEAATLQSFPKSYEFCGEKSAIYRQIGNAVPCRLAEGVAMVIQNIMK